MIVVRKFFGAFLWFVIFMVIGFVALVVYAVTQVDLTNEATAAAEAEAIGQALGLQYGNILFLGSAGLAILGSLFGVLPLTRHRRG